MKIYEIEYGHWNKPSLPESEKILDATQLGKFDNYIISNVDDYYLILNDDFTYMGYVRASGTDSRLTFHELYVPKQFRRKGVASSILLFITKRLGKQLVCNPDEILTDDSRQVIYKLVAAGKLKCNLPLGALGALFRDIDSNDVMLVFENKKSTITKNETCFELFNPESGLAESKIAAFGNIVREQEYYYD